MHWDSNAGDGMGTWVSHDLLQDCLEYQRFGVCSHSHTGEYPRGRIFQKTKNVSDKVKQFFENCELYGMDKALNILKGIENE
jgi:hypothetical protein